MNTTKEVETFSAWIEGPFCPVPTATLTPRERYIAWISWLVARGAAADVAVNYPSREAPVSSAVSLRNGAE